MSPEKLRDMLVELLNDNPLAGQEGRADAIEGGPAIGLEIDEDLFFVTVSEA